MKLPYAALILSVMLAGCTCTGPKCAQPPTVRDTASVQSAASEPSQSDEQPTRQTSETAALDTPPTLAVGLAGVVQSVQTQGDPGASPVQPPGQGKLQLNEVISSVYATYPLLESALASRELADGNLLAAQGAFDLKLKAASDNGPVGYYQTYRQLVGLEQPLYSGSDVFAGYRIGRGTFQPWYLERQTNDGGEFKAGVVYPLARNRSIDSRRAELWRAAYGRDLAEPDIQAQLIEFVQEASYAYWDWVAAGQGYQIARQVLSLAESRTDRIKRQVESGLIDPPELTDNLRLVADRRAKLADSQRKLEQKAAKLSLYLRDEQGRPVVPAAERLPVFPAPELIDRGQLDEDVQAALKNRPELRIMDLMLRQLEVDYAEARNELLPEVDAVLWGSQDVGAPTSSKRDKSPFELEASLLVEVPLQRRKARGKADAVQAKMQQLSAKRQLTEDKISVELQSVYAALVAAYEQVVQARTAVRLADELAQRERRNFELGASDLLKVTLREQYAAESALKEVDSLQEFHQALVDYRASMAVDRLQDDGQSGPQDR